MQKLLSYTYYLIFIPSHGMIIVNFYAHRLHYRYSRVLRAKDSQKFYADEQKTFSWRND